MRSIKHLSLHEVDGVVQRNFFETQIKVIEKVKVSNSIIVFDVDGLKLVNDTLGHARGDKLLQMVADIISIPLGLMISWPHAVTNSLLFFRN